MGFRYAIDFFSIQYSVKPVGNVAHRFGLYRQMSDAEVQRQRTEAYQQEVDEVLHALGTDARRGLSDGEARARLDSIGKNELAAEDAIPRWRK